ncbi:MAG: PD-(D/E)XK nuclease family protein [Verrucomicrobiae bacterium]|nr:PD-(D/E)XK nuclease family protein [Verrucomicrobiae bacterium]
MWPRPRRHSESCPNRAGDVLQYLSASRLKCWQSCRRQFFYRYVERIETPTAPALFLGQAVHELLRLHNWSCWKDEPLEQGQVRMELDQWWEREEPVARVRWKTSEEARGEKVALVTQPSGDTGKHALQK